MRDPHARFCERHGGVISRAYSTLVAWPDEGSMKSFRPEGRQRRTTWSRAQRRT
jgi:hypothetical protein